MTSHPHTLRGSVVMAAYNAELHLSEAIESVLAQTFSDFEFIIVNDGSVDGTLDILNRFAAQDSRIRLISRPNRGLPQSLNEAVKASSGEYILRMDADDKCLSDRFETQIQFMDEHPELAASGSDWYIIDQLGYRMGRYGFSTSHEELDALLLSGVTPIMHPSAVMRRECLLSIGGYDERFRYSQDFDLWLRAAERYRLGNINRPLIEYRIHPSAVSSARSVEQLRYAQQAVNEAYARRNLSAPPPQLKPYRETRGDPNFARLTAIRDFARIECNWLLALKFGMKCIGHTPLSISAYGSIAAILLEAAKLRNRERQLTNQASGY